MKNLNHSNRDEFQITLNEIKKYENSTKTKFSSALEELDWARTQNKTCTKCKKLYPLSCFNGNTCGRDPFDKNGYRLRRPECRACTKKANKGLAETRKNTKIYKPPPGTVCEICGVGSNIVFDHNHETGVFRGWLCDSHNRALGIFKDSVEGLQEVINYLMKFEFSS